MWEERDSKLDCKKERKKGTIFQELYNQYYGENNAECRLKRLSPAFLLDPPLFKDTVKAFVD